MFGLPMTTQGLRVGLLGGSFDPPHQGHVHITQRALRRFDLDQVWWLVSPGNPLKADAPAALARRVAAARQLVTHPRVHVTGVEAALGTRVTADTLAALTTIRPGVRFVWLMGADNLAQLHRWESWTDVIERVPIGVLARPGEQLAAGLSPAARRYARFRLPPTAARLLPLLPAPAWTLLPGPMIDQSSTALRSRGAWSR